jgi:hypothetical protein
MATERTCRCRAHAGIVDIQCLDVWREAAAAA